MKKRIALFANGWNSENLNNFMNGIQASLPPETADVFVFLSHAAYGMSDDFRRSERLIYDLPNLNDFDGAIIFGPGLNFQDAIDRITNMCSKAEIPVVSIGLHVPGFKYIGVDNYVGMSDLCNHLLDEHNVKKVLFIGGSKENEDSQIREKALADAMSAHNLPFTDKDIFYSNWEMYYALGFISKHLAIPENRPDAIICANDQLAVVISLGLEDLKLEVPDDLIVTGFDFTSDSQMFYPAISSVDQHFDEMGKQAANLIMEMISGKDVPDETIIPCSFMPGESCGCSQCRNTDAIRRIYTRHIPLRNREESVRDGRFSQVEWSILGSEYYSQLGEHLGEVIYHDDRLEGPTFALLMDSRFSTLVLKEVEECPKFEFNEIMDVIVCKYEGKKIEVDKFPIRNLFPGYTGEGQNHIFTFMPLYYYSFNYGYMVMCDNLQYYGETIFRQYNDKLRRIFDSYRKNLKLNALNAQLSELMQRDALTSARNRIAYENFKATLTERFKLGDRTPFAVAMFDINDLKVINDRYGHESGDVYIKNSCKLICDIFKHSPVFRIGGDEFVAIVSNSDYPKRWELLQSLRDYIDMLAKSDLPEVNKVSIASGMAEYQSNTDTCLEDVFRRADDMMYKNKHIMKNGEIR